MPRASSERLEKPAQSRKPAMKLRVVLELSPAALLELDARAGRQLHTERQPVAVRAEDRERPPVSFPLGEKPVNPRAKRRGAFPRALLEQHGLLPKPDAGVARDRRDGFDAAALGAREDERLRL